MHIALLTLKFHLPGCSSLKEKRHRLMSLRDKYGKIANIAVSESQYHDNHQSAEWSFVVVSSDKAMIEKQISQIEQHAVNERDAIIEDRQIEWL